MERLIKTTPFKIERLQTDNALNLLLSGFQSNTVIQNMNLLIINLFHLVKKNCKDLLDLTARRPRVIFSHCPQGHPRV